MLYHEVKPNAHLAPYVRCFWYMERDYSAPGAHEVVWPDGRTELLFISGAQYDQEGTPLPTAMLIGPLTQHPLPGSNLYKRNHRERGTLGLQHAISQALEDGLR